jgi:hypothetical protein
MEYSSFRSRHNKIAYLACKTLVSSLLEILGHYFLIELRWVMDFKCFASRQPRHDLRVAMSLCVLEQLV